MKIHKLNLLIIFFIFILSMYILSLRGIPGNITPSEIKGNLDQTSQPFELSPERGRFILTMSLAENKSFALTKELADAAFPDVGYFQGRFYVFFAPGISIMALPFYTLGKYINLSQVATFFFISIFASLTAILLYKISKEIFKFPTWLALFVPLIFAFGTTSWSYAITLYQHHLTTFFIVSSFYATWLYRKKTKLSSLLPLWIWLAYALAISIDYPNAILMLPIMIYFAMSAFSFTTIKDKFNISLRLSAIAGSIVFIIIISLHAFYNYANFGDWKRLSGSLIDYRTIIAHKISLSNPDTSAIKNLQNQKSPIGFFTEEHLPSSNTTLLFSKDRGLFFYMPIFVLAIAGFWTIRKHINTEIAILLALVATNVVLYSSWGDPWGGWAFGPRYLIPSMASLSIFVGLWLNSGKINIWKNIITFILFAYSCAISLLGALTTNAVPPKVEATYLHSKFNFLLNYDQLLNNISGSYFYNQYASHIMSLIQYYCIMLSLILCIAFVLLFIIPKVRNEFKS